MKLLTLNTHSLEEPGYVEKTEKFIEMLSKEQPEGSSDWFFTVHMGWWNDEEEPFVDQWKCIQETLKDPKYRSALRTLSVTERMHRSYRIITEL